MKSALSIAMICFASALPAQQATPLHDGDQVTLRGQLTMRPAGRLQFVTIKTAAAYMPVFTGDSTPGDILHEIGLSGYNRYDLLFGAGGQTVTVTGKMMTDNASPYYFHGTSLAVTSIREANGAELIGTPRDRSPLPIVLTAYTADVALPANPAVPWQYRLRGTGVDSSRYLSCSSNGGGDVVNCSCADGFHPVSGDSITQRVHAPGEVMGHLVQFGPVDDAHIVQIAVTCSR